MKNAEPQTKFTGFPQAQNETLQYIYEFLLYS